MDGWGFARALAPHLPRALGTAVGGAVLVYMIASGNYGLIWSAMASGVDAVSGWLGLYGAMTRIATP